MDDDKNKKSSNASLSQIKTPAIPTIDYMIKTYAGDSHSNEKKVVRVFLDFETREKLRQLRNELVLVKDGKVSTQLLDQIVGRIRKNRYQSYQEWAGLVLKLLAKK